MQPVTKITRFGYIIDKQSISETQLEKIKADLTVTPFKYGNYAKFAKNKNFPVYVENGNYIGVPKYYGIEKFGKPNINRLESYEFPVYDMVYTGKLRPRQEIIMKNLLDGFEKHRGGLLVAACGIGKTNLAIYAACHFKLKTLFIVHKNFLKRQAIDRVLATTNITHVGSIQRKTIDVDHPFVVGMVHSLAKIDYDDKIFRDFGLIIIDEVHHMGAKNFSKVYQKMSGKYMLGISAEKYRADNMYKIIHWYMGPILHEEEQKPNDMVVVKKYHYRTSNKPRSKVLINKFTQEADRSRMTTNLVHIRRRNQFILNIILTLFDEGKNVLFLTGRIKHVNLFYRKLNQGDTTGCVGKYIGSMSEQDLSESATKQIILGTFAMAEEGLDIEGLNVVILATPKGATKQSIGRILRKEVYETHPIVIDIEDSDNSVFTKQSQKRNTYYEKQHYRIQNFHVSDYLLEKHQMYDDIKFITDSLTIHPEKKERYYQEPNKMAVLNIDEMEFLASETD